MNKQALQREAQCVGYIMITIHVDVVFLRSQGLTLINHNL